MYLTTGLFEVDNVTVEHSDTEIAETFRLIARAERLARDERAVLRQCFSAGPVWAGDIASKAARETLVAEGFLVHVVSNGEEGFTACTCRGARLYRIWREISHEPLASPGANTHRGALPGTGCLSSSDTGGL